MDDLAPIPGDAFENLPSRPPMSLRAGNAVDSYETAPDFDAELDRVTPEYLEQNFWGVAHLDAVSWQYYLPILMAHALRNIRNPGSMAVDAFLASLRPPDRDPPRFAALTPAQEQAVARMLDILAFQEDSAWKEAAMIALEEYWAPGAIYRDGARQSRVD